MRVGVEELICVGEHLRVRSLKIEDTIKLIWDKVIGTIETSHLFKEIFKKDTMKEKKSFGAKRLGPTVFKKIKRNEKTSKDIEDTIDSNSVDGILDKQNEDNFKSIIGKFEEKKRDLIFPFWIRNGFWMRSSIK